MNGGTDGGRGKWAKAKKAFADDQNHGLNEGEGWGQASIWKYIFEPINVGILEEYNSLSLAISLIS